MDSPMKWHGGKGPIAHKIRALFSHHLHYVEPYAGSLAVLFSHPSDGEGTSEVVNDLNKDLMSFWSVLQSGVDFVSFARLCQATPFSEPQWQDARLDLDEWPQPCEEASSRVVRAWRFFVCVRQSLAGRMKDFAPLSRTRIRRGMNEQASAWLSAVDGLPEIHARLRRVVILNRPALEVISSQDNSDTLFYLDPPYLHETRATTSDYQFEMTRADHEELLDLILTLKGKVVLSGYPSELYHSKLSQWHQHVFDVPNHASHSDKKGREREVVWCNFSPVNRAERLWP
jgi:DNA adenine methylase